MACPKGGFSRVDWRRRDEEGWRNAGLLLTARPEASVGGWSGALFRLVELHVATGRKEKDGWLQGKVRRLDKIADSLP